MNFLKIIMKKIIQDYMGHPLQVMKKKQLLKKEFLLAVKKMMIALLGALNRRKYLMIKLKDK